MAKLTVHRDAHRRKAYTRKDGTKVKGSKVDVSRFQIKDRGAKGRTPKIERFFRPSVHTGWEADMSMKERRRLVLKAHGNDKLASGRAMIALSNVQHRINPDVSQKARADGLYFLKEHKKSKR